MEELASGLAGDVRNVPANRTKEQLLRASLEAGGVGQSWQTQMLVCGAISFFKL